MRGRWGDAGIQRIVDGVSEASLRLWDFGVDSVNGETAIAVTYCQHATDSKGPENDN